MNAPALAIEASVKANQPEGVIFERYVKGVKRTETRYPVTCQCGRVVYRTKRDAGRLLRCQWCANSANGKKGYRATVSRYGEKSAQTRAAAWRLDHPSSLEQAVMLLLDERGVSYDREYLLTTKASRKRQRVYALDFWIERADGTHGAVEVQGRWVHERPEAIRRDRAKRSLLTRRHIPLLILTEADIRRGEAEAKLVDFIGQPPPPKPPSLLHVDCPDVEGAALELLDGSTVTGTLTDVRRVSSPTAAVWFGHFDGSVFLRADGDSIWRYFETIEDDDDSR